MTETMPDTRLMTDEEVTAKRLAMQESLTKLVNDVHKAHESNHMLTAVVLFDVLALLGCAILDQKAEDMSGVTQAERVAFMDSRFSAVRRFWESYMAGTVEQEIAALEHGTTLFHAQPSKGVH